MSAAIAPIPVILFAYARSDHLGRTLATLRENRVPRIVAFTDGARSSLDAPRVAAVRAQLRAIDWCEVTVVERAQNLGLGKNVIAGVSEVAARDDAFIVWEDDLVAVPGTYQWICSALRHYALDERVMSVTAWTHPRVTPADVGPSPYFDGRAECWVWGAWARSWRGVAAETALEKLAAAKARGFAPDVYGADLPVMAAREAAQNIWAVRFLYHHLQHGALCVRPPWSMVEHIGFDPTASNAEHATAWANPPLRPAPPIPTTWPEPREHPQCRTLWRAANPSGWRSLFASAAKARSVMASLPRRARQLIPRRGRRWVRRLVRPLLYAGDYTSWAAAQQASRGYNDALIREKVVAATRAVREGRAAWERDSVLFKEPIANAPVLRALRRIAAANDGRLGIVDFGGALGSTWWQHRGWLGDLNEIRWSVVEQPGLVAVGQREFTVGPLLFYPSLATCLAVEKPMVILLSGVLAYLEDPQALLREIRAQPFQHLVIDRTGFMARGRTRLTVQHVPPVIYPASYPAWFFERAALLEPFAAEWRIVDEWVTEDDADIDADHRGMWLERKTLPLKPSPIPA